MRSQAKPSCGLDNGAQPLQSVHRLPCLPDPSLLCTLGLAAGPGCWSMRPTQFPGAVYSLETEKLPGRKQELHGRYPQAWVEIAPGSGWLEPVCTWLATVGEQGKR